MSKKTLKKEIEQLKQLLTSKIEDRFVIIEDNGEYFLESEGRKKMSEEEVNQLSEKHRVLVIHLVSSKDNGV